MSECRDIDRKLVRKWVIHVQGVISGENTDFVDSCLQEHRHSSRISRLRGYAK
jgi:hypothetical protein